MYILFPKLMCDFCVAMYESAFQKIVSSSAGIFQEVEKPDSVWNGRLGWRAHERVRLYLHRQGERALSAHQT